MVGIEVSEIIRKWKEIIFEVVFWCSGSEKWTKTGWDMIKMVKSFEQLK